MKFLALAVVASFVANPAQAQDATGYSLDGEVEITLPKGWDYDQIINPAMKMKAMRDMMNGASETRMEKGGTKILVSYMNFKSDKPSREMDEETLAAVEKITFQAAGQYLPQANESQITPRSAIVGPLGLSLATLSARDGEQFRVAPGTAGGCVTTGSIRRDSAAWAVSIASKSCESDTHKQAVEAFFAAQAR